MNRDPMRVVAWCLVGLGVAVLLLTVPLVRAANENAAVQARAYARLSGRYEPSEPALTAGGMILTGGIIAGFGMLLLAIRRPQSKPVDDAPKSVVRAAIVPPPLPAPYPKARAVTRPPWEKDPNE